MDYRKGKQGSGVNYMKSIRVSPTKGSAEEADTRTELEGQRDMGRQPKVHVKQTSESR